MNKKEQEVFKEIVETHSRAVSKMPLGAEKPKMQAYFEWLINTLAREADDVTALEGVLGAMSKMSKRAVESKDPFFRDKVLGQIHEQLQRLESGEDAAITPELNERGDPVPRGWKKIGIIQ